MHSFQTTRPTQAYEYLPKIVPTVQAQGKLSLAEYFLKYPYRTYMGAFAVTIALVAGSAMAQSQMPEAHQQGDIAYISGGIGADETAAIESVKGNYNLNVTSADRTGHFRGDTEIVISDMKRNVLLDVTSQGPLFYAQLPNGRYVVEGISEDQSRKQTIRINGTKPARVHFSWPVSSGDFSEDANLRRDVNLSHD